MIKINGKVFMNLQEAVQWLLDNNALPYQCTANYVANTEIGIGTIVNPSPAKVRIGSLIIFADCKVATVTGITDNGFMVGSQYIDYTGDVVAQLLNKDIDVHDVNAHEIQTQLLTTDMLTVNHTIEFERMETISNDSFARIFEAITDDNLHKRFVEGNCSIPFIAGISDVEYNKWSLSGSHLLIACACSVNAGTSSFEFREVIVNLPDWIKDKLITIGSGNNIAYGTIYCYDNVTTGISTFQCLLIKQADAIKLYSVPITAFATNAGSFRIQFDLLIDNE